MRAAFSFFPRSYFQHPVLLAVAFGLCPGLAWAGLEADVTRITIDVIHQRTAGVTDDFAFEVVVEGVGMTSASVQTPAAPSFPTGQLLPLLNDEGDLIFEVGGFASLNALQQRFANGTYTVTVNGISVGLVYNQAFPDGTVTATLPANNAMIPNGRPTFTYTDTCSNCNAQETRIEDGAGQIDLVLQSISPDPLRSSVEFSDFPANLGAAGNISELPQGTALDFCVVTLVLTQTPLLLGGVDAFDYRAVTGVDDLIGFTVVAPGKISSDVIEIFIEYLRQSGGTFSFEGGVDGGGLVSGTFVPPNQAPIPLVLIDGELQFAVDGFENEAAVLAAFPPTDGTSKYVFSIDGGQKFYSADFMPGSPDGDVQIISPTEGEQVSSTPTVVLSNDCMNCGFQFVEIEDEINFGGNVGLNADSFPPFPTVLQVPADFDNEGGLGLITELPDGDYFMFAGTGVGGLTMATTTPTDDFDLFLGNTVEKSLSFTVPEPSGSLLALTACAALAVVARRRRVRSH